MLYSILEPLLPLYLFLFSAVMAASQPSSNSSSPIQPKTQLVNKDDPLGADVEANKSRVKVSGGGGGGAVVALSKKKHTSHCTPQSPTRSPSQRRTIAAHDLEKANFQLSEQVTAYEHVLDKKTCLNQENK